MDKLVWIKTAFAACGTAICTWLGGWDVSLQVLVILVVCDYVTGLYAGWYHKELSSYKGSKGITKKIILFVPIGMAYWLDVMLGQDILRGLAIWFYVANEGLSIIENLGKVDLLIPKIVKDALEQLKSKAGE